jgi:Tetracyclin repressor-like, C-terminal domain
MVHGLIAEAQRDTQLSVAWRDRVVEPLRAQHRVLLNRAIERGRDPGERRRRARHAVRPAYHRLLHGHRPFTGMFVRRVVDVIMDGIAENAPG